MFDKNKNNLLNDIDEIQITEADCLIDMTNVLLKELRYLHKNAIIKELFKKNDKDSEELKKFIDHAEQFIERCNEVI